MAIEPAELLAGPSTEAAPESEPANAETVDDSPVVADGVPTTDEATPEEPTTDTQQSDVPDSAEDGSDAGQRETRKQREERRRAEAEAARRAEEDARIAERVQAELERREREAAERKQAEAQEQERRQRFGQWLGDDAEVQQLRTIASAVLPDLPDDPYTMDAEAYRQLQQKHAEANDARRKLTEFDGRRGMLSAIAQDIKQAERLEAQQWLSSEVRRATDIPDVGSDFLAAPDPYELIKRVRDSVAGSIESRYKDKVADLEDEIAELRAELGGDTTHRAGRTATAERAAPVGGNRTMTRDEFMQLPWEQRQKLRREQPALIERIYAR